jgi:thymidylate synthase (FAD)
MTDPEVIVPDAIAESAEGQRIWDAFLEHVTAAYRELRELGVRKEDARFVLPNATATRIIVTMNFRELLHFFRLRITPEAQWEIRRMALAMLGLLVPHAPTIFGDLIAKIRQQHPGLAAEMDRSLPPSTADAA